MPVDAILTAFRLVTSGAAVLALTKENLKTSFPPEYGRLYDKSKALMSKREVLDRADSFKAKGEADEREPVQSPIVDALCNLYAAQVGVIYVMYAPAGQGKTFGAQAFLKHFCSLGEGKNIQGFMITGQSLDGNYMSHLGKCLGATDCLEGWIHALLLALDEPDECQPSVLILDGMNSLGQDNVNEDFIKELYGLIEGKKNLYIVIMSSEEELASKMCTFNHGQRIQPLPNTFEGETTAPKWNKMKWKRDQLIQAVKYAFPDFPDRLPGDEKNHQFEFVTDQLTPLQAVMMAKNLKREVIIPGSPTKKKA